MKLSTLLNVLPKASHDVLYDIFEANENVVTGLTRNEIERLYLNKEVDYILPCEDYDFFLAFEIYLKGDK